MEDPVARWVGTAIGIGIVLAVVRWVSRMLGWNIWEFSSAPGPSAPPTPPDFPIVGARPAPLGKRLIAHLVIDFPVIMLLWLVCWMLIWPLELAAMLAAAINAALEEQVVDRSEVLVFFVAITYLTLCHGLWGATVGKWAMGIRVVRSNGRPPGWWALLRTTVVMLGLVFVGITWWPVLWRKDRRAIHDLAAGTTVVRLR